MDGRGGSGSNAMLGVVTVAGAGFYNGLPFPVSAAPLSGVVTQPDPAKLAQAMVESCTEFDYQPGLPLSIPDALRDNLTEWCAALIAWDHRG